MAGLMGEATSQKAGLMSPESVIKTLRFSCTNGSSIRLCAFTSSYQTLLILGTENVNSIKFEIALASVSSNIPVKIGTLPDGVHLYLSGATVWIKADYSRHIEFCVPLFGTQTLYLDRQDIPSDAVEM